MIENIEIQISYSNLKLVDLIIQLSDSSNYSNLLFLNEIKRKMTEFSDFNIVCNDVFNDKNIMTLFDDEDIELLKGFFSGFAVASGRTREPP